MDKIKISLQEMQAEQKLTGMLRIRPEAEIIIRDICMMYDIPASKAASKIIVAAAPFIEFVDNGIDNDKDVEVK